MLADSLTSAAAKVLAAHILIGATSGMPVNAWHSPASEYAMHLPVEVLGNAGFHHASGVVGGDGSPEAPYLIEGWDIVPMTGYGIRLVNTSAHVLIRNNLLHEGNKHPSGLCHGLTLDEPQCLGGLVLPQVGIVLENASNVQVMSNRIFGNSHAIVADNLVHGWISGNHLSGFSSNVTLGEIYQVYRGAVGALHNLTWAPGHTLLLRGQDAIGLQLRGGGDVHIYDNVIEGFLADSSLGKGFAAILDDVSHVLFVENQVRYSDHSLDAEGTTLELTSNRFSDTGTVVLAQGSIALLESNGFFNVTGLSICGLGTRVQVLRNDFVSSHAASDARNPYCGNEDLFTLFHENAFRDTRLDFASHGEVRGNTFSGPTEDAALYLQGFDAHVHHNTITGARIGLLSRRTASLVEGNEFIGNAFSVFSFWDRKPILRTNAIEASLNYSIFNTDVPQFSEDAPPGTISVDAEFNWWGGASGPNPEQVFGAVDYVPWLMVRP